MICCPILFFVYKHVCAFAETRRELTAVLQGVLSSTEADSNREKSQKLFKE